MPVSSLAGNGAQEKHGDSTAGAGPHPHTRRGAQSFEKDLLVINQCEKEI